MMSCWTYRSMQHSRGRFPAVTRACCLTPFVGCRSSCNRQHTLQDNATPSYANDCNFKFQKQPCRRACRRHRWCTSNCRCCVCALGSEFSQQPHICTHLLLAGAAAAAPASGGCCRSTCSSLQTGGGDSAKHSAGCCCALRHSAACCCWHCL